jgi:hypothetical protein
MTLPAHLVKYDGLIDLMVEALVREIEEGARAVNPGKGAALNFDSTLESTASEDYRNTAPAAN